MIFNLFGKNSVKKQLAQKQREATLVHEENIKNIVESREPAYALKKVLKQNHIIIQIAGAVGGK